MTGEGGGEQAPEAPWGACGTSPWCPSPHNQMRRLPGSDSCRCTGDPPRNAPSLPAAQGRPGGAASLRSWPREISSNCSEICWSQLRQRARGHPVGQRRICTCRVCPHHIRKKLEYFAPLCPAGAVGFTIGVHTSVVPVVEDQDVNLRKGAHQIKLGSLAGEHH